MECLFKNITAITMENENCVRENVCVLVKDGKIKYVGDYNDDLKAQKVYDGKNKVLIPGLYNCHSHSPMTLLRGYANDLSLQEWLFDNIFPAEKKLTREMTYVGAKLSIAEMIASGTISFTDMYFGIDMIAKAAYETGVKANLSNAIVAFDDSFSYLKDKSYKETLKVLNDYKSLDKRIKADAGIHAEYTSFPRAWAEVSDFALKEKLNMHIHLSETKFEHEKCVEKYGKTPTEILCENGVFSVPTTAAHCVFVTDSDMDILKSNEVTVAHNPVSNLKLASGIAPVAKMLEKGINVALGTDGVASNNSSDLFEELKLASILQKASLYDPTVVKSFEALKMATVNGAKSQGRGNESGMIKEGYDADLVMLDFNSPRQTVCYDHVSACVYSVTGRDVYLTMCQGNILYENGEYFTLDIERLLYEANDYSKIFKNI